MRLVHPDRGTVVHVSGELADRYRAAGWREPVATPEKPKPTRRSK